MGRHEPAVRLRKRVYYSGRVQGVGFRYTVCRIARRFDVAGVVRNLADGRVELVVEGTSAEISGFLQEILTVFAANVTETHIEEQDSTGEFTGFEIRA